MAGSMDKNPHIGGSLDDFLKEEGLLEEFQAQVLKEVTACQLKKMEKKRRTSQSDAAPAAHKSS